MPNTTHCFVPVLGKRLRITQLDSCGNPLAGGNQLTTDGFVSVSLSSETEDGAEIIVRNAAGAICVNERQSDSFTRFTVEIHFCGVNPALLGMITNAEPYADYAGDQAGITVGEGQIEKWFALELWTGLTGGACAPGVEEASGYLLLPFVTAGVLGDLEVNGTDAIDFSVSGASTRGGNQWGVGPYDVVKDDSGTAAVLPTALDSLDHLLLIDTAVAPPPASCDPEPIPVPDQTGSDNSEVGTATVGTGTVGLNASA